MCNVVHFRNVGEIKNKRYTRKNVTRINEKRLKRFFLLRAATATNGKRVCCGRDTVKGLVGAWWRWRRWWRRWRRLLRMIWSRCTHRSLLLLTASHRPCSAAPAALSATDTSILHRARFRNGQLVKLLRDLHGTGLIHLYFEKCAEK